MALVRSCLITAKEVTHLLCIRKHSVMLLGKGLIATETQFYGVFCFVFFPRGEWV